MAALLAKLTEISTKKGRAAGCGAAPPASLRGRTPGASRGRSALRCYYLCSPIGGWRPPEREREDVPMFSAAMSLVTLVIVVFVAWLAICLIILRPFSRDRDDSHEGESPAARP
jgi:hypothetical protein